MGIQERKARYDKELREKILKAAEALFIEEGYRHVSMRRIAEKIEYSPTTIYRLFRNKAEVMSFLIADGYRGVYDSYRRVLEARDSSPLETLGRILRVYVEFALDHPNHYELWFATGELDLIDGQMQMRHGDLTYKVYGTWLDQIEKCRAEGLFSGRDTMTVFQMIWGVVHGLISLRIRHGRFPWLPLDKHMDETLSMLKRGLV